LKARNEKIEQPPVSLPGRSNFDGFGKSPSAALRFTFVAAAYPPSTPHSGGFARRVPRNAGELFTWPSALMPYYEIINFKMGPKILQEKNFPARFL
jgi:hypothetical protein